MSYTVNQSNYIGKPSNVNVGRQIKDFGPVIGMIGVKPGTLIDASARADLEAFFSALALNNNPYNRCYGLHNIVGWEESNGEAKTESLPNGTTKYIADGKPVYTVRFDGGGFNQFKILRSFKNSQNFLQWFIVHETGELGGKVVKNADGSYDLAPISFHQIFPMSRKFATDSASETQGFYVVLNDTKQVNDNYGYIDIDFDLKEATAGVVDVHLEATNATTTKWNVKALAGYTKQDMSAMFPTELAATTAFVVKNKTLGTTLTVSAVAAKVGYFEITLSAAPTATNVLTIQLASISVLKGLNVEGYESDIIEVVVPA